MTAGRDGWYDRSIDIPLGDATLQINLRIPGTRRIGFRIHVGVPTDTTPADRIVKPSGPLRCPGRPGIIMDLAADKQVSLSVQFTDEVGNPTGDVPDPGSVVYSTDRPDLINLTDNGDGTGNAAAVGALGLANVHVDVTTADGVLTGDLQLNVVAGLAERVNVVAGEPTEVTPDV